MPAAMTALATITLGSAQATVTFGSIPATYRDLRLVVNAYGPGGDNSYCRFNSDSGANYPQVYMYGNGSSAASSSSTWSEQYLGTLGTAMTQLTPWTSWTMLRQTSTSQPWCGAMTLPLMFRHALVAGLTLLRLLP
jgi:hypothetical protein